MALRTKALNTQEPAAAASGPSPWKLEAIQQPRQARMCGSGEKADRRPLDPPPIIRLRIRKSAVATTTATSPRKQRKGAATGAADDDKFVSPTLTHTLFCFASLVGEDDEEEIYTLSGSRTKHVTGSVVSSLFHLKDQSCFVFPDLSVRTEGRWRFKMSMYEIVEDGVNYCTSIFTDPFTVYSSKRFPGMSQSTELSRAFAQQGLRLRIRRPGPGGAKDDDDESVPEKKTKVSKRTRKASAGQAAPVRFSGPPSHTSPTASSIDLRPGDASSSRAAPSTVGERSISPPSAPDGALTAPRKRSQEEASLASSSREEARRNPAPQWSTATEYTSVAPSNNSNSKRRLAPAPSQDARLYARPLPQPHSQSYSHPPAAHSYQSHPAYSQGYSNVPRYDERGPPPPSRGPPPPPRYSNPPPVFHYYQPSNPSGGHMSGSRSLPPQPPLRAGVIPSVLAPIHTHTREFSAGSSNFSSSGSSSYHYDTSRPTTAGTPVPPPHQHYRAPSYSAASRSPEETASWERERQRYQSQQRPMGSEGFHSRPQQADRRVSAPQRMEEVEKDSAATVESSGAGPSSLNKLLGDGARDAKEIADPDEPFFF